MNEDDFREIDETMLFIEEARARAERGVKELRRRNADEHLVTALDDARTELSEAQKRLLQRTHFAVPAAQSTS